MKTISIDQIQKITYALVAFFLLLGYSCTNSTTKEYTYIELAKEKELIGNRFELKVKNIEIIEAKDDTTAYLMAFEKFIKSVEANRMTAEMLGKTFTIPQEFSLLTPDSIDISDIQFVSKYEQEAELTRCIASLSQ